MRRGAAAAFASDFAHHAPGVARLNHGSFGAAPLPVLQACAAWRDTWLAQPDALYFAGRLEEKIRNAEHAAETALAAPRGTVALVENATVAAAITLRRWCTETSSSSKALVLSCAYGGLLPSLRTAFPGDRLVEVEVPFPGTTHAAILERLDRALLANRGGDGIAFALLDHVASQPALELPIRDVIALCRERGVREVAVDAAHAVGNVAGATDVTALDADVWWTNFHKWGHAAPTCTALYARVPLSHVVPSWDAGDSNVVRESRWPGTRDFGAAVSLTDAVAYAQTWRSVDGLDTATYNRAGLRDAADTLKRAWGVDAAYDEAECFTSMGMIRLPDGLDVARDVPGVPSGPASVRSRLRDRYGVEAAVGGFRKSTSESRLEGYVRLSHACYTTDDDIARLRDAVLDLADEDRRRL